LPEYCILNRTKGTILADKAEFARSFLGRLIGLLNKRQLPAGYALILIPCRSIHTFFMRMPIDCLFLNRDLQVIKIVKDMKPFRLSGHVFEAQMAVELPAGIADKSITELGDTLEIKL
jgi:hypothetical protein